MIDRDPLVQFTIFLAKGRGSRPWRLSVRTLSGSGVLDRYYGSGARRLDPPEVEELVADLTKLVREYVWTEERYAAVTVTADQ